MANTPYYTKAESDARIGFNNWNGKKMTVLGDSISYGYIPENDPSFPGQLNSYAKLTAENLSMTFVNNGISGSTLGAIALNDTTRSPFVYRYQNIPDDSDLVIVMGGANDAQNAIPLGAMFDTQETTYYGALDMLCQGILNKFRIDQGTEIGKTKSIVFCTPLRILGVSMSGYAQAVKDVCAYYGIPVWDAYNLSGITPHVLKTFTGTSPSGDFNPYIIDGVHPTQEGHYMMSKSLIGFLNTI